MSYTPTIWSTGDVISANKLNKMEEGIAGESHEITELKSALNLRMYGVSTSTVLIPTQAESGKVWNGSSFVDNSGYTAYKYLVTQGDTLKIIGCQPSSSYLLYRFYDINNNQIASSFGVVITGAGRKEVNNVIVPNKAAYMWINTWYTHSGNGVFSVEYETDPNYLIGAIDDKIETKMEQKMDGVASYTPMSPAQTESGKIWQDGTFVESTNYCAYKFTVAGGVHIRITGTQPSVTNLLARFYDSDNSQIATTISSVETGTGVKILNTITPSNCSYVWVNTYISRGGGMELFSYNTSPDIFKKPLTLTKTDTGCFIDNGELKLNLRNIGANDIFNIYSLYCGETLVFATNTDWFGPYNFTKVGATGDFTGITTGGNHSATSGGITVTTGRTTSVKIYADNAIMSENGIYYANKCRVEWVNEIMASNTVRIDGTGEYCIEEHYCVTVDEEMKLAVEHWFKPLVDCMLNWYSGMQFASSSTMQNFLLPQFTDSPLTISEINPARIEGKRVERLVAYGADVGVEMYIDRNWGMPSNMLTYDISGLGNKVYFIQQGYDDPDLSISAGSVYVWKGYYRFFKVF